MGTVAKNLTHCAVCGRDVGAVLNWEKQQAGRLVGEYRVTRHAVTERASSKRRRPLCAGGGILVPAEVVWPRDETSRSRPSELEGSQ